MHFVKFNLNDPKSSWLWVLQPLCSQWPGNWECPYCFGSVPTSIIFSFWANGFNNDRLCTWCPYLWLHSDMLISSKSVCSWLSPELQKKKNAMLMSNSIWSILNLSSSFQNVLFLYSFFQKNMSMTLNDWLVS